MNQKFSASMEFQRTDGGIPSLRPLCPVCRAPEETPQPTGLRQAPRVAAGDPDDPKGKGKPKKRATTPEDLE